MEPLARALEDDRPSLEVPWDGLSRLIKPVPGTLMIVAGAPGAGKSMFALAWALKLGEPVRLVSLDTDPATQALRAISCLSGVPIEKVSQDRKRWAQWLREQDAPVLVMDRTIAPDDMNEILAADTEYWGDSPGLVVVDDVSKLSLGERGYLQYEAAFLELHRAARMRHSVVLAIHHLHRGDNFGASRKVTLGDLKYTGEYEAEIVLGVYRPEDGRQRISVLKNRFGEDDPNGDLVAELDVDLTRMLITDHHEAGVALDVVGRRIIEEEEHQQAF